MAGLDRVAMRFDASASVGGGHAVRCLALADALADQGADVLLLVNPDAPVMLQDLGPRHSMVGVGPGGAAACAAVRQAWPDGADLAVVDHYGWGIVDERQLRPVARHLAVIDDLANRAHDCDLLVDQNLGRSVADYAGLVGPDVPLLVGPRHALLRAAFAAPRAAGPVRAGAGLVVVSPGLGDPGGVSASLCEALARTQVQASFHVVLSPSAASHPRVAALCGRDARFVLSGPQDGEGMARLLAGSVLAVGGAGVSAWERCALGVPSLVLVLAENQRAGAEALARAGAGLVFEADAPGLDALAGACADLLGQPQARALMAAAALEVCDGRGARRVAAALGDMMQGVVLRPARIDDGEVVWRWRNAPAARAASRVTDEIPLSAHLDWYKQAIASAQRVILIGQAGGRSVGMVRFDETDAGVWDVSIALDPAQAGRGLGGALLQRGCAWMEADRGVRRFTATARASNAASLRIFAKTGFSLEASADGWVAMVTERTVHGTA